MIRKKTRVPYVVECCQCGWFLAGGAMTSTESNASTFTIEAMAKDAARADGWQLPGTEAICPECVQKREASQLAAF